MDDTISRQDAIETVRKAKNLYQAHRMLIQLPSVDAVPVVHGRWIFGKDDETGERDVYAWACSVCGEKYPWRPHYCPNCGADMRDGREVFANG